MPQGDGVHKLKRIEFEFMGNSYKFVLNPEEYRQTEPARVTVTQTKGGAWVDNFGDGVPMIQFKGTTGFRSPEARRYLDNAPVTNNNQQRWLENILRNPNASSEEKRWAMNKLESTLTGFLKFKELRDLIRKVKNSVPLGAAIPAGKELIFHNYTDDEHWIVVPRTFELMRSIARPLLYQYDIQLICIRQASQPVYASSARNEDNLRTHLQIFDLRKFGLRGEK
ncbi:hypothetical protein D1872_50530 [compost metagenome]